MKPDLHQFRVGVDDVVSAEAYPNALYYPADAGLVLFRRGTRGQTLRMKCTQFEESDNGAVALGALGTTLLKRRCFA